MSSAFAIEARTSYPHAPWKSIRPRWLIFGGRGCLISSKMPVILAFSLTLALLLQGGSCGRASTGKVSGEKARSVQAGESWGGEHVRADVEAESVNFEFDCARGASDEPLAPGVDGRFDLKGFFITERGAQALAEQQENRRPARYSGRIKGKTMTLSVTLTESGENIGTFTLTRGQDARLTKCM